MLQLKNVTKRYRNHTAVDQISFEIPKGEIFGLLGPNGAGKSSLLRMITGITHPDEGEIRINNQPFNALQHNPLIGYMPEERGLYKKMRVGEHIEYLGVLKGMSGKEASKQTSYWLEKMDIASWKNKNIEDLSKGMSQKVQFITTILHQPQLLILDEPFSGLDPVNAELIKNEIYLLAEQGVTIIFSTHRMEQVEEICNSILLINKGKEVLSGRVDEIKQSHKMNEYILHTATPLEDPESIGARELRANEYSIVLKDIGTNDFIQKVIHKGNVITGFQEVLPSLNDIFIKLVDQKAITNFEA